MVERWGAIEADFLRHYNIHQPLETGYKRFLRLLSNLPFKDSVFYLPMYIAAEKGEDYITDPEEQNRRWYKKQFDKIRGRDNKERKTVSLNEFMGELRKE